MRAVKDRKERDTVGEQNVDTELEERFSSRGYAIKIDEFVPIFRDGCVEGDGESDE